MQTHPHPTWRLIPNLIGYSRIIFLFVGMVFALHQPIVAFIAFFISANLDALDGYCARRFNQSSKLGAALDFATDRVTVTVFIVILIILYQSYWLWLALLLVLDIFSHICQIYATVFVKSEHHKHIAHHQGRWLMLYYSHRGVLYATCALHDGFLISLYLYYFYANTFFVMTLLLCLPGFLFKIAIHLLQITSVFRLLSD